MASLLESRRQGVPDREAGAHGRGRIDDWSIQSLLSDMRIRAGHTAVLVVRGESIETLSYAEIAARAGQLAFGLIAAGVRPSDAVVIYGPNSAEWIIAALAVGACAATLAPIDDVLSEPDAASIIADSGADLVFTTAAHCRALHSSVARAHRYVLLDRDPDTASDGIFWRNLARAEPVPLPPVTSDTALCLSYTSGTTGQPKGIVLSYANIGANVRAIAAEREAEPEDRVLLPLPLHHSYPFVIGLLLPLTVGAAVVLPEGVSGPQIVRAARVAGATVLIGVPRLYEVLLSAIESRVAGAGGVAKTVFDRGLGLAIWARSRLGIDLGRLLFRPVRAQVGPHLRAVTSGGAKLDPDIHRKLAGLGWFVFAGYGLAETASVFTTNARGRTRFGSAGKAIGDGEMRIAEPDENGTGEILLRGSNITSGYRNNPEATKAAFTADGWFRTGDLGYIDRDGYLYVTGRAKEMIVLGGGKKVFPEPIEKLYGASPYIREIAVLERSGDLVALVRPNAEAIRAIGVTLLDDPIRMWFSQMAQQLPPYQRLSGFALVEEALPRTRLGKYRRFLLPDIYERVLAREAKSAPAPLSDADRAFLAEPIAAKVWALLRKRCADKALTLEANLAFDLALDSFDWMEISLELEEEPGIQLTGETIAGLRTVRDLIVVVKGLVAGGGSERTGARHAVLPPRQRSWLQPTGRLVSLVASSLRALDKQALARRFHLRVEGTERLPDRGPLVIAPNHASEMDAFVIAAALPFAHFRRSYWAGDDHRMFSTAAMRLFSRVFHVFPVDERAPMLAIESAAAILARGDILVWFSEGWLTPDGRLQRFRPGIGKLLTEEAVPVVPTYIAGTFDAMPRGRRWPRHHPIRVVFGDPVSVDALESAGTGETREERIAGGLHEEVAALARSIGSTP